MHKFYFHHNFFVTDFHEVHENKQNNFRIIRFNDKKQSKTKSNHIVTARYGILSFIPLFFIEQLRCFANQYLLFISTLQVCTML